MKTIYDIQDNVTKKEIKKQFKEEKPNLYLRIIRLVIIGLLIVIYCLGCIIYSIITKDQNYYFYGAYILFLAAGVFFLYEAHVIKKKELNKIAKKRKDKQ